MVIIGFDPSPYPENILRSQNPRNRLNPVKSPQNPSMEAKKRTVAWSTNCARNFLIESGACRFRGALHTQDELAVSAILGGNVYTIAENAVLDTTHTTSNGDFAINFFEKAGVGWVMLGLWITKIWRNALQNINVWLGIWIWLKTLVSQWLYHISKNVQNSCGMWVLVWFKNHGYIRWTSQSIQNMNTLIVVHVCKRYLGTRSLTSPQIKWCNQQQWRFNPSGWQSIYIAIASEPVWQRIHDTSGPFSYWMLGFHHIVGRYCPLGSWLSSPASP